MQLLTLLDAFIGMQGRNVLLCGQLCCSFARFAISKECKFVHYISKFKHDTHEDWMWPDAEKDAAFRSYTPVDS
jgi:hypothetical protein